MLPHQKLLAVILVSSLLTASCLKDAVKSFGELQSLHNTLTQKFGDEITLHISDRRNGGLLSVAFINSPLNERTRQERSQRAEETAQIIHAHYAGSTFVTTIYVMFLLRKTQFIVFNRMETVDDYGFEREGQQLRPATPYWPAPPPDSEITAGYSATDGGTDITASTFQLDGEPGGYGITVLPHFRLPGDARRKKALPPEEVSFFFASYSRKPRFGEAVPIEFIADGTPVMQRKEMFTGNDAQYCSVKVSYSVFRKMITAKEVVIKLGAREYPLTPKQLETLQKMDAYVLQ